MSECRNLENVGQVEELLLMTEQMQVKFASNVRNYGLASQGSLLPSFGCRLTQAKPTDSPQDCLLNGLAR